MEESSSKSQYLEHLQNFNTDKGKVVLSSDVKNDKGVLLAAKGERLSDKNVDLMIRHKLCRPLDNCIGLEPAFNAKLLKETFDHTYEVYPDVGQVVKASGTLPAISSCLHHMEQYELLYQKLTVMAHVLPNHFERSILKASLALSLAIFSGQSKANTIKIFYIALIENIGYLHIDRQIPDAKIPPFRLWKSYHSHPLIAKELLKSIPGLPPSILRGVAEHHERIDGTGFPAMKSQDDISEFVPYTGIADELTRLMFAEDSDNPLTLLQLVDQLQYRRKHFPNKLFAQFQLMIRNAHLVADLEKEDTNVKSSARTQHFMYAKCLIYCDVIARIADAISLGSESKSLMRLQTLSKNFIDGVFESGMLSGPIRDYIEDSILNSENERIQDLIDIDHGHRGILDQISEIFLYLEYALVHETHSEEVFASPSYASLEACFALLQHIQRMETIEEAWQGMIDQVFETNNDLATIIQSMRQ